MILQEATIAKKVYNKKLKPTFKLYRIDVIRLWHHHKNNKKNKQVTRQFFEPFDRHDTERMEQLVSTTTDYSLHFSGMPTMDWNGHKQLIAAITSAFADIHHDIEDVVAEGEDKVAIRMNVTGTHKGEFLGVPQSGKKGPITSMDFFTIIDGKFVEHWVNADMLELMQQIGAIPTPPPSPATGTSTSRS